MNGLSFVLPAILVIAASAGMTNTAQGQANAPRRQVSTKSPDIQPDGKVTFRLRAPKAAAVSVNGQWTNGQAKMTKDDQGNWSVTVGPIEAGVWEYSFDVDGVGMIDPGNTWIKPMREPRTSILHIPGNPPNLYDFRDVPHGTVRQHTYLSKALGRLRELTVDTPPNYDKQGGKKFPTLYLQHGSGDNQATWTTHGKAHWILDNLIAEGKAKPMVVVMMDGHAAITGGDNTKLFEQDLMQDVMPFIEANYKVKTDSANRGIVGLSMGGGQSLTIGLNHMDKFAWVGGFSSSAPDRAAVASAINDPKGTNKKLKLLWIGIGKDDFLMDRNKTFTALLKEQGINFVWHLSEGGHSWPNWRNYLGEFLPRLF